jgi:hypothetical protein
MKAKLNQQQGERQPLTPIHMSCESANVGTGPSIAWGLSVLVGFIHK